MAEVLRIGPVNRVSSELDVEVTIDGGKVTDARLSATMARGFELILRDKDPRDALVITQRVSGLGPASHALASAQAMDDIVGAKVPARARVTRNLVLAAEVVSAHIASFYATLLQDYFDPTAVSLYRGKDRRLAQVADKMKVLLAAGDTAPFVPRYESPDLIGDPSAVAGLLANYLDGLAMRRKAESMTALAGGRHPHVCSIVTGGVTMPLTGSDISRLQFLGDELAGWIESAMLPDALALAKGPMARFGTGTYGAGHPNFLSFGLFDGDISGDYRNRLFRSGAVVGAAKGGQAPPVVQDIDPEKITESLRFAWYTDAYDGKNPGQAITEFSAKPDGYTFVKGARYDNRPMEVGPLARMMMRSEPGFTRLLAQAGVLAHSLPGRVLARAYEAALICRTIPKWLDELSKGGENAAICDDKPFPASGRSIGLVEGARGAVGHWVSLEAALIDNYQIVSASGWNASPRDASSQRGPIEQALIGTPVPDPANPLDVLRVIRSFDPMIACAVH